MRDLFRRASFLFWQFPSLWIPLFVADAVSYCSNQLGRHLSHLIVLWVYGTHSVLSSGPEIVASPGKITQAALLAGPLTWGGFFFLIFAYTMAMAVTSAVLHHVTQDREANFSDALFSVSTRLRDILRFSFKVLVFQLAAVLAVAVPLSTSVSWFGPSSAGLVGALYGIVAEVIIAFLVAPSALRLLQPSNSANLTPEQTSLSRLAAILTVGVSSAIGLVFFHVSVPLWDGWQSHAGIIQFVLGAVESAMSAAPYILLFIAFFLVANPAGNFIASAEAALPSPPAPLPPSTAE